MDKKVDYKVTGVTVFPDRARISCLGNLQVDEGYQTLIFDDLPLMMDVDSVRVGGMGSGQVRIIGTDIARSHYEQSPSERVTELENQIELLTDNVRELNDQYAGYEAQAEHLHGMRLETQEYAKGLARGKTSVAEHSELMQFLVEQDETVRAAQRKVQNEIVRLERQIDKLQRELDDLQNVRPRQRFQARVDVEAVTAAEFRPELTYVVRSAGWQPLYDIRLRLDNGSKKVNLNMIAQVSQRTGQDWTDVKLVVSTARPALNQRLPEQKPWYVNEYQSPQPRHVPTRSAVRESSSAVMAAPTASMDAMEMTAAEFQKADISAAQVEETGTVASYMVQGRWDIPSDGSPHKMLLNSFDLDPKLEYVTIPRHTNAVYRRATVTNLGDSPLLAGAAMLFVNEDFIGKTQIEYTPRSDDIELLLGVEEQVKVERELSKREVDKRFLRENRVIRYAYEIRLENLTDEVAAVEVHDQIPVSRHEQIKVKLDRVSPELNERSDLNLLEWKIELKPKAKQTLAYEFVVEHPRAMKITGLID